MKLTPPVNLNERHEIVRKRTWSTVRNLDALDSIIQQLQRERFLGEIRVGMGPGGVLSHVVAEERGKVS